MADPTPSPDTPAWRADRGDYPGWQIALSFALGWLLTIAGVIAAVWLPFSIWQTSRFVARATHVQAPIVDFREYPPSKGHSRPGYRPIVAVPIRGGGSVRVLVGEADYADRSHTGDRLDIMFMPSDEVDAVLNDFDGVWGNTLALGMLALVGLLLGGGAMLWMRAFVKARPRHLTWLERWFGPLKLLLRLIA